MNNSPHTAADGPAPASDVENAAEPTRDALWVSRAGARQYTAHNGRGGSINVDGGDGENAFTPGELLKLALAACAGLSADVSLARRLGDDFDATVHVSGPADRDEERYHELSESFEVDFSNLEPDARDRLVALASRAIDKNCTVGRTLKAGAGVQLHIVDTATGDVVLDA